MSAEQAMPGILPAELPDGECVYLLHFSHPFGHARHYLGWAADLAARLADHAKGNGTSAGLLRAAHAAGVTFTCVRWWPGDRHLEASLKNHRRGSSPRSIKGRNGAARSLAYYCPACSPRAHHHRPEPAGYVAGRRTPGRLF